jgi:hypothetical protein
MLHRSYIGPVPSDKAGFEFYSYNSCDVTGKLKKEQMRVVSVERLHKDKTSHEAELNEIYK